MSTLLTLAVCAAGIGLASWGLYWLVAFVIAFSQEYLSK